MLTVLRRRCLELYWTLTAALGLKRLHGFEGTYLRQAAAEPFLPPLALALRLARCRLINPHRLVVEHIGHLAMDFDAILKEAILRGDRARMILLLPCEPANAALFAIWAPRLTVVRNRFWRYVLGRVAVRFPSLAVPTREYCESSEGASRCHRIEAEWGRRPPLAVLEPGLAARGEAVLRSLGVPEGAWFVCVHSREGGHLPQHEWAASFRNTDISTYVPAMRLIVERGGWCIRVGDASMTPLPPMPGVVDYALSPAKSDWMDLFLCARCRFFLGNTSGLFSVAGLFGRPSALANITPFSSLYSQFPTDLSIPKLLTRADGEVVPFPDVYGSDVANYRVAPKFVVAGLRHVDNTPEEIGDLAAEMLARTEPDAEPTRDDELQALLRGMLRPHHYCWHSRAQVGRSFLQRHRALLTGDHPRAPGDPAHARPRLDERAAVQA